MLKINRIPIDLAVSSCSASAASKKVRISIKRSGSTRLTAANLARLKVKQVSILHYSSVNICPLSSFTTFEKIVKMGYIFS